MEDSVDDSERKDDLPIDDQNSDIDFVYNDADEYGVEIAELYTYSEEPEFKWNAKCFDEEFYKFVSTRWFETNARDQHMHILRLMDRLESSQRTVRQKAIRGLLYLLQGNFGDCELEEDQITWARRNVHMCIEAGLLSVACQVLLLEIAYDKWSKSAATCEDTPHDQDFATNKESVITAEDSEPAQPKKGTLCMADSADLRAILSILYIMVETVRDGLMSGSAQSPVNCGPAGVQSLRTHCSTQDPSAKLREQFLEELSSPIVHDSNTTLTAVLFDMVHRFCSGLAPHFPMKKVLLLLWKVLLVTLGPTTTLCAQKNLVRARWGLPPLFEDSHQVVRRIRATSPPGASNDQALSRGARPNNRHAMFGQSNQAPRQGILANSRCNLNSQRYQSAAISSAIYSFSTSPAPLASSATEAGRTEYSGYATPRPGSPVTGDTNGATEQVNHPVHSRIETPLPILNRSVVTDSILPQPPPTAPHLALGQGLPNIFADSKSLPWKPKVRKKDLETFLNNVRLKFLKFQVPNDTTSLIGLPEPIHEAVKVLREHLYVSLGEMQIEKEEKIIRYPMSLGPEKVPDTPVERLYRDMHPILPQYMIALLRVLLAASPTSRSKTEPINILTEVMPVSLSTNAVQTAILNFDVNRHKELIVKAISAILLLLLKHMKLNHIYQFEYVSQYLVFANCIPLILKFFNQNTGHYVHAKNSLSFLDFPSRLIGKSPELTPEMLRESEFSILCRTSWSPAGVFTLIRTSFKFDGGSLNTIYNSDSVLLRRRNCLPPIKFRPNPGLHAASTPAMSDWSVYCWRNLFSCINLLRILNMLTKWKHSRTMLLVVFKSAPILKRALRVRHAMLQLYVLKLLKLQSRYFGRQWRKNNMPIMSAIYQKVRHRLTDDWAYGNDVDAVPWRFQLEEQTLRANVDQFNRRRYSDACFDPELQPVDNSLTSVLGQPFKLSDEFKRNYEKWLEEEVFSVPINWSQLLAG